MSEEQKKEEQQKNPATPEHELPKMLNKLSSRPSQDQIDKWKAEHGNVFISGFSETELFIWRTMKRKEFVDLQTKAQELGMSSFVLEEATCKLCVLWPDEESLTVALEDKAGTAGSLSEQIMQNSNFLSPAAASVLVAKL